MIYTVVRDEEKLREYVSKSSDELFNEKINSILNSRDGIFNDSLLDNDDLKLLMDILKDNLVYVEKEDYDIIKYYNGTIKEIDLVDGLVCSLIGGGDSFLDRNDAILSILSSSGALYIYKEI